MTLKTDIVREKYQCRGDGISRALRTTGSWIQSFLKLVYPRTFQFQKPRIIDKYIICNYAFFGTSQPELGFLGLATKKS